MARAPFLFCAPSTFCLTTAWANPNTVFFALNEQAAVVSTDSTLQRIIDDNGDGIMSDGLTMIPIDYLPGQIARAYLKRQSSTMCVQPIVYLPFMSAFQLHK